MIGEPQGRQVMAALKGTELEGRVHILPLLPNWKVPSFLRACSAVCVLERGFPVKMHGPIVPREVVACGVCLVLSKEIADKQDPRRFVPDQNVLVVDDPRDHAALAAVLRRVIEDPTWAQDIGARGVSAATSDLGFAKFAARWDSIIVDYDTRSPEAIEAAPRALDLMLPRLLMLFKTRAPDLLDEFLSAAAKGDVSPWRAGLDFCDFAANRSSRDARLGVELARLLAALRYQKARLIAGRDRDRDASASFVVTDQLQGSAVTPDLVSHLRPVRGSFVFVEEFDFDVLQLVTEPTNGNEGLELLRERRTLVLFARSPNSVVRELRIDDATRRLIDSCDGRHTTAELVQDLGSLFAVDRSVDAGGPADPVLRALDSLYRSKAVVFGEYRVGWGWTGGVRAKLVEPDGRIVLHHVDRKLPPSA
jgi:hypothetical protein